MTRPLLRALTATTLSVALVTAPTLAGACGGLKKKPGQTWMQFAGELAHDADDYETRGLEGDALKTRERVMLSLTCAWREDKDPSALEPLLITLHRRLKKSTTAVEVALRLIYELHGSTRLTTSQEKQLTQLNEQLNLALLRLRRDAKPGNAAACDGPVGRRPGELAIQGLLPDEPVLVLRDVPGGNVEVVECPLAVSTAKGTSTTTCPACPPPLPAPLDSGPWWLTGFGGALALGAVGAFVAARVIDADADDKQARLEALDASERTIDSGIEVRQLEGQVDALDGTAIIMGSVGLAAIIVGVSWALGRDTEESPQSARFSAGPNGASVTLDF